MAVVQRDNVAKAQKKTSSALSMFAKAHAQVVQAEELLQAEVSEVDRQIDELLARRDAAKTELQTSAQVKAKLAEFLPTV
jgi:D-aminopeptidase